MTQFIPQIALGGVGMMPVVSACLQKLSPRCSAEAENGAIFYGFTLLVLYLKSLL